MVATASEGAELVDWMNDQKKKRTPKPKRQGYFNQFYQFTLKLSNNIC